MYFLGQAANYRAGDILRHTFAFGARRDFERLRRHLAQRYLKPSDPDDPISALNPVNPSDSADSFVPTKASIRRTALYGTGRSALAAAVRATTPKGSAVCATALTCYAVVQAIEAAGCQPVFADVDPDTLHYGAKELLAALKKHPEVRTIIVQNNLGYPADMAGIEKIARQYHLAIIEDLAHSAGVRYADGREAGTVGDATILSFGKGKSIDTIAGGALILRDPVLKMPAQPKRRPRLSNSLRARWYPFFGACIRGFYHLRLGRYFTSLLLKLHLIERSADAPLDFRTRCTYWQAKLALRQLERLPDPRPPLRRYYLVPHRDQVLKSLEKMGHILNDTWYDCPVAPERYFAQSHFRSTECPTATHLAQHLINAPLDYPTYLFDSPLSEDDWRKALQAHPEANFLQSPEWRTVNDFNLRHRPFVEQFGPHSFALMIIKNAKRGRYLEIPGGPLLNWDDAEEVKRAFARIREIAQAERCVFVRFRPQLPQTPDNLALLRSIGATVAPFHLHAEHTVVLDLAPSTDTLLKNMRRQTRYEVRRALKQGITVTHGNDQALFEEFHRVQAETAARQHFIPPRLEDLLAYRQAFGDQAQIYVASNADGPIAYGLILTSGDEADYFEAASTPLNRKIPGAYALQWQVIQDLKAQGFKRYNLWGIAPPDQPHHRYAKVTTFKTGFGGTITEYLPAHDLVIKPIRYRFTKLFEQLRNKRRHLS